MADPNVLYSDDHITIVREGGIPVFSAIGYLDSPDMEGISRVCQEGMKTYDYLKERSLNENMRKIQRMSNENRQKEIDEMITIMRDNLKPGIQNNLRTLKKEYNLFVSDRTKFLKKNANHLSYVYFRAPMTFPTTLDSAGNFVHMDPKDAVFDDYYGSKYPTALMSGGDGTSVAGAMVIIRVDPKRTRVYSSLFNTYAAIPKSQIIKASVTLEEYMDFLKTLPPGHHEMEMEIIAKPPGGILSSTTFSECFLYDQARNTPYDKVRKAVLTNFRSMGDNLLSMYNKYKSVLDNTFGNLEEYQKSAGNYYEFMKEFYAQNPSDTVEKAKLKDIYENVQKFLNIIAFLRPRLINNYKKYEYTEKSKDIVRDMFYYFQSLNQFISGIRYVIPHRMEELAKAKTSASKIKRKAELDEAIHKKEKLYNQLVATHHRVGESDLLREVESASVKKGGQCKGTRKGGRKGTRKGTRKQTSR